MWPQHPGSPAPKRGKRTELAILGALVAIVLTGIVVTLNSGTLAGWRSTLP